MHHPVRVLLVCDCGSSRSLMATESCLAFPRDIENLHWDCPNPLEAKGSDAQLTAFRTGRDQLRQHIEAWLPDVRGKAGTGN